MELKKCLMGALCASMAFGTVQVVNVYAEEPQVVHAYETVAQNPDMMTSVKEIDKALLAEHARAKSEMSPAVGQDGPASWAFDDQDHWWHTKWQNEQNNEGKPSASNPIWIQTGFGGVKKIKKITYLPRANGYGTIQNYSVQYANTNKADSELVDSDFHEIKTGRLDNVRTEQTIEWPEAVEATHIRLVATGSVYTNGGQNYVMAKRIRVFEEKEYDILKHTQNWDYERSKGTLRTQTKDDTWYYQVQNNSNGEWINLPDSAFNGTTWMQTGNSANAQYYYGKLARDEITSTLGNSEGNKYKALAFTWKAPRNGYFRVTLENPIGAAGGSPAGFVKYSKNTSDGTLLWNGTFNQGTQFESRIAKMSQGEFLRIGASKNDAWATGFQPMVVEVKASEYAPQYMSEVDQILTQHAGKPAVVRDQVTNVKNELKSLVDSATKDEVLIDAKIKELEAAVANVVSYVAVESIILDQSALNLKVGQKSTLTATVNPDGATVKEVVWESNQPTVVDVVDGVVTAKGVGTATITVKSVAQPDKVAQCTITVESVVNKGDLQLALNEAKTYQQDDYTEASWTVLQGAVTEATAVYESQEVTQTQVDDAVNALMEAISGLKHEYKVTVEGAQVAKGEYNTIVTIKAPQAPEGQKFAGWDLNGVVVSTKESYTFAITGNLAFTAKFVPVAQEVTVQPQALLNLVQINKLSTGKHRVEFTLQIIIPKGYVLEDTGLAFTKDSSLNSLHDENGVLKDSRVRTLTTRKVNVNGQYKVAINGVPKGANIYTEVYAKLRTPAGDYVWAYSPLQTTTVK